ncbi:Galactoside O-acetyltransferase [Klebsiella variicola subsp. variicola]|nr:maltose O-acetyltransferase [Klebsiella variicola]VVL81628.1 Galactoside O-acetyltransferase [Klebsiella variicola]
MIPKMQKIDYIAKEENLSGEYEINYFSFKNKLHRLIWGGVYIVFFKYSPVPMFGYRNFILSLFGARLGNNVRIYPSAKIWMPRNLTIGNNSSIGPRALIYNQGSIYIGNDSIISQDVTICASTHDYNKRDHPLILKNVEIGNRVWLCAESFVGPGVQVFDGAVLGARAVAKRNLSSWSVYDGNPCNKLKERMNNE